MGRVRSLIAGLEVDRAIRSHNCQANAKHRVTAGSARLKVSNGRSYDNYCIDCARIMLRRDIDRLSIILDAIEFQCMGTALDEAVGSPVSEA